MAGGKLSKTCITGMEAANAMGDKLPMLVIGKTKNPRCFKNIKFSPCRYRNQRKSWMVGKMLEEWLRELGRKFAFEGRIVAFVIDSCPAHPHIFNLKSIKLYFLPPNTTSKTQPMDQGVISKIPQECCPENYSKCRQEEKPFENFVAASNANVSLSLGCAIDANGRELLSKVWNIHQNPGNGIA